MSEKEKTSAAGAGLVLGGTATVLAAIALVKQNMAKAAPGDTQAVNEAILELMIAMAGTNAEILTALQRITGGGEGGPGGPGGSVGDLFANIRVQGFPDNTKSIIATRVPIAALLRAIQLPDIAIPNGHVLQIKGWPTNGGIIYVSDSRAGAINVNQAWPLLANEAIGYAVQNAEDLYISGTAIGDFAAITVEQRR